MFPKQQIDGFEKYWQRRKPGSSTAEILEIILANIS
jgi:hypothetical protein